MPWSSTRPGGTQAQAKYRTAEHRRHRAALVQQIEREGYVMCTAKVCLFDSRAITNTRGRDRDGLHLGHEDNGIDYAGPQHNLCNVKDGAVRGSARSHGVEPQKRSWSL